MTNLLIQQDVPLAPLTTFKIGGPAKHFVRIKNQGELLEAITLAKSNRWPVFVLAGGSNLIVSDQGFDGLVVSMEIDGFEFDGEKVTSGAATSMKVLVDESIKRGLGGLEWAGGLPGSFGGAIRGNAGAFGGEIKDTIFSVSSVDVDTGKEVLRDNKACQFGYRDSLFKHTEEVITQATVSLRPQDGGELRRVADEHIQFRHDKHPMEYPNAGSIFKNIPLEHMPKEHLSLFADAVKNDPFPIVPTAKVIAVAGIKGMRVGDAELSEKHTNYMVNLGQAKAADLVALIEQVKSAIKDRYQIDLEVEPELVGF